MWMPLAPIVKHATRKVGDGDAEIVTVSTPGTNSTIVRTWHD